MKNVKLVSVGTFLPGQPIGNDKIQERFSVNAEWIELAIGNRSRHLVMDLDTGEINYTLADICNMAAFNAINKAGVDVDDIDFIVMGTATPDSLMPATVNMVAEKLGINNVATYQVQSGCAGAMQAIDMATKFLRLGEYSTGLVIGGDVCAKYIDTERDFSQLNSSELINYALFGDGAGAAVLSNDEQVSGANIVATLNRCEGLYRQPGQELNWLGSRLRDVENVQPLKEDYKAIEEQVPVMAKEVMMEIITNAGWNMEHVNHFMTPQLAGHMTDKIIQLMEVDPAKAVNCVADTGNNGNALPFLQLEMLMDRITDGEKAIGVAIESSKWIKGGIALQA
ncbi:3-oxoacyl-ACP synthase III family protein [Teredinibacter turnerae]|uniref:3-oxoacyl-ACP synthase III family protein n=1 Tax=Teredinibacter turnerae TaxID=2426 RepID=UPI0003710A56|nr:3-oxoacyl-ACP synthase III family protein [Teredinibacter turnerae]